MWKKYKTFIISIVIALSVGGLSALITMKNMKQLFLEIETPPLSPPSILFPIVWTILYALMGFSSAVIFEHRSFKQHEADRGLILYGVNLFLNFFWSIIFFNMHAFTFAFIWLLILWSVILAMIAEFYKVNRLAAYLQIPYAVWVTFAGYLTFGISVLN